MATNYDNPSIYVADLKAYNEGKLIGEWIDLTEFDEGYEVMEKISDLMDEYSKKYHNGMETEYAIHDFENFSRELYSESMGEEDFDIILKTHKISEERDIPAEVLQDVMARYDSASKDIEGFIDERYRGQFDTETDFAYDYVDVAGGIEGLDKNTIDMYFDYAQFGSDYVTNYIDVVDGHYFDNSYAKGGKIKTNDLKKYMKRGGGIYPQSDIAIVSQFAFDELITQNFGQNPLIIIGRDVIYPMNTENGVEEIVVERFREYDSPKDVVDRIVKKSRQEKFAKGGKLKSFFSKAKEVGGKAYAKGKERAKEIAHNTKERIKEAKHNQVVEHALKALYETRKWDYGATSEEKRHLDMAEQIVNEKYIFEPTPYVPTNTKLKAKGGDIAFLPTPMMDNFHRNIMGTLSFDMQVKPMRKAQDFIVYPMKTLEEYLHIQSNKKFGYIRLEDGKGILSKGNGNTSWHLRRDMQMGNVIRFELTSSQLEELKFMLKQTGGSKVGSSVVFSDNSGVSMLERGGNIFAKGKEGRYHILGVPKSEPMAKPSFHSSVHDHSDIKQAVARARKDFKDLTNKEFEIFVTDDKEDREIYNYAKGGLVNKEFLSNQTSDYTNRILQSIADYYGTTKSKIQRELFDDDAEMIYEYIGNDSGLRRLVYEDMENFKNRNNFAKGGNVKDKVQRTDLIVYYPNIDYSMGSPNYINELECSVYAKEEHHLRGQIDDCLNNIGVYNSQILGYKVIGANPYNYEDDLRAVLRLNEMRGSYNKGESVRKFMTGDSATFGAFEKGGEIVDKYDYITLIKTPNSLRVELTDDGIEAYNEEEVVEMYDLFEDVQGNSEWKYIDDAGQVGFGLTSAPIITDGFYYDDNGEFTDDGHSDSKVYTWNNYMVKDLFETLMEQGSVELSEVKYDKEYAKGGGIPSKFYWIKMDRDKIDEYIDYASRMRGMFEGEIYTQGVDRVAFETDNDRFAFTSMIENHNNDNDLNEGDEGYIFYEELFGDKAMPNIFDRISSNTYDKGGIVKRKIGGMTTKLERFKDDAVKDYNNYKYYYKTSDGKWDDLTNTQWKKKVFDAYMSQKGYAKGGMTKSMEVEEVMQDHFADGGSLPDNFMVTAYDVSYEVTYNNGKGRNSNSMIWDGYEDYDRNGDLIYDVEDAYNEALKEYNLISEKMFYEGDEVDYVELVAIGEYKDLDDDYPNNYGFTILESKGISPYDRKRKGEFADGGRVVEPHFDATAYEYRHDGMYGDSKKFATEKEAIEWGLKQFQSRKDDVQKVEIHSIKPNNTGGMNYLKVFHIDKNSPMGRRIVNRMFAKGGGIDLMEYEVYGYHNNKYLGKIQVGKNANRKIAQQKANKKFGNPLLKVKIKKKGIKSYEEGGVVKFTDVKRFPLTYKDREGQMAYTRHSSHPTKKDAEKVSKELSKHFYNIIVPIDEEYVVYKNLFDTYSNGGEIDGQNFRSAVIWAKGDIHENFNYEESDLDIQTNLLSDHTELYKASNKFGIRDYDTWREIYEIAFEEMGIENPPQFANGGNIGKNITYSATFDLFDADGNNIDNPMPSLQFDVTSGVSYGEARDLAQQTFENGTFFEEGMKAVMTDFWMGEMDADEEDRKRVEIKEQEPREEFVPRVERSGKWDASYSVLCDELATYEMGGDVKDFSYEEDILPILKESIDDGVDEIDDYENVYNAEGEEIEYKGRPGFIPYTDGGYEKKWFEYISILNGSGTSLPTKVLDDEMERQVGNAYEYAKERFIEDNEELVEEIGEDKVNYHDLYELGMGEKAEELSEMEMDMGDDSIMMSVKAFYYKPSNSRAENNQHTITLIGDVNLESPYHRVGNLDDYKEITFTFNSKEELEDKMSKNMEHIIDWFGGDGYSESTREMKVRRMAKGGKMPSVNLG